MRDKRAYSPTDVGGTQEISSRFRYAYNLASRILNTFRVDRDYNQFDMDRRLGEDKRGLVKKVLERNRSSSVSEANVFGIVAELSVLEGIKNGWLGKSVDVAKASDYDDVLSGVDLIVEIPSGGEVAEPLNIGLDVTTSVEMLERKLKKSYDFLHANRRFPGLYFFTPKNKNNNGVSGMPIFPIYLSADYIRNFYLPGLVDNSQGSIIKENDPYQIMFLEQIKECASDQQRVLEKGHPGRIYEGLRYKKELARVIDFVDNLLGQIGDAKYIDQNQERIISEIKNRFIGVINKAYINK